MLVSSQPHGIPFRQMLSTLLELLLQWPYTTDRDPSLLCKEVTVTTLQPGLLLKHSILRRGVNISNKRF